MKNTNKLLTTLCAMTIAATSFVSPISADTKTVDLKYTQDESYKWSIPTGEQTISTTANTGTVSISDAVINSTHKVSITVAGANYAEGWKLKDTANKDSLLSYSLSKGGTELANNAVVLEVLPAATNATALASGSATLSWKTNNTIAVAGTYKDTLTFTATVINK